MTPALPVPQRSAPAHLAPVEPPALAELIESGAVLAEPEPEDLDEPTPIGAAPSRRAERRTWRPWPTWDPAADAPGPVHGPRRDLPGGRKAIPWPDGARPGELVYFATPDHRPPAPGSALVLTEGEKAADAVAEAGWTAAATVCGAASDPSEAVVALLARYRVTLAADHDELGRRHMARLAGRLERLGAPPVRWIDPPPDAPKGWDLADVDLDRRRELLRGARELLGWGALEAPARMVDDAGTGVAPVGSDSATWRTLADISDDPPGALLFGMLEPDGSTLAYAAPGVGKGTTGAWLVVEALAAGLTPVIFDAERRPREWARRVAGFGGDRSRVVYIDPGDLGTALAGRPFWDQAEAVGRLVRAAGGDLFILDSLLPASGVGEERLRSDAQAPFLFVAALDGIGASARLAFGHPPKGQPEGEPFGSMAWLAAFRMTWLGTTAEGEGHRIRWRPKKRNERGHVPGVLLTVTYGEDGRPCAVERADDEETTRDALLAALVHGPRRVPELAEEILDEMDAPAPGELERVRERVGRMLRRMAREGWVERVGPAGGRNVAWQLRVRDGQA